MLRQDSRTEIGADPISPELVNTKSLANDGGLEEILKEIEGIGSLNNLLAPGAAESLMGESLKNEPQVFLGAANDKLRQRT